MALIIPVRGPQATPFIPDTGYSFSGSALFDNDITISNGTSPFGATGPTLALFDDFRGGTPGNTIASGTSGVAGSSTWGANNGQSGVVGNLIYAAGNRSGSGNCIRLRDTTYSDISFNQSVISFAATQGLYIFWAENSHGYDYSTQTTNGGNNFNYKMHWGMTGGHTGNAFNAWLPAVFGSAGAPGQQNFGSNDEPPLLQPGGSGPFFASSAIWDPNNWNSAEMGCVGTDSAPGLLMCAVYNPTTTRTGKSTGQFLTQITSRTIFSNTTGSSGTYDTMNTVSVPGLIQGFAVPTVIDRADYYVAVGANCLNRFFIGDQPTIGACTTIMPCTINSWSANSVSIRLRRGAFSSPSGNYLYWSDSNNNISRAGRFA